MLILIANSQQLARQRKHSLTGLAIALRALCAFRQITRMIRHRSIAICFSVKPDFVTARRLPVKDKSAALKTLGHFTVSEP